MSGNSNCDARLFFYLVVWCLCPNLWYPLTVGSSSHSHAECGIRPQPQHPVFHLVEWRDCMCDVAFVRLDRALWAMNLYSGWRSKLLLVHNCSLCPLPRRELFHWQWGGRRLVHRCSRKEGWLAESKFVQGQCWCELSLTEGYCLQPQQARHQGCNPSIDGSWKGNLKCSPQKCLQLRRADKRNIGSCPNVTWFVTQKMILRDFVPIPRICQRNK